MALDQSNGALLEVLALPPDEMGFWCFEEHDPIAFHRTTFDGKNGVGTCRHRRTRHDADGLAGPHLYRFVGSRRCLKADDAQRERVRRLAVKSAGKAVHGRIVERWVVDRAGKVFRQNPVNAFVDGDAFRVQRRRGLEADGACFLDRNEVGKVIHGCSKEGSCLRLWVNGRMMEGGSIPVHG